MWLQIVVSLIIMLGLQILVWFQSRIASGHGLNTVEQVIASGKQAQSFDRHYGMVIDFVLIAPFTGFSIFLCGNQWKSISIDIATFISIVATAVATWYWKKMANPAYRDPHNSIPAVNILHAVFMGVVLAVALLVVFFTPEPPPVLMLAMCIVMPAFLFAGQHMYLGVTMHGDMTSYPPPYSHPLQNWGAWVILGVVCGGLVWHIIEVTPSSFWPSIAWS